MIEQPLFRMPTGYQLTIRLTPTGWWTVIADRFYEGEPWNIDDRIVCERLSLTEATDFMLGIVYGG